ncbi:MULTISPECIES: large-conductance mechanosensitive channel protein MscL [Caproicibacterium]|uniref:Large-conductance mechanosensitive channel n=1 Tax=Caproicibacterium argilliputei TaxID=3030016 RepID=A0AA97D997_9FIRM|nr:large-conductance mechanosensitive channel protein MscL [Caproicibacterium argilliputei]WOC31405.1 large-conductance mechanosensitive channel protein MscL [Caproicibacterium argilliputei]
MKKMIAEFREFAMKGNVMDLAIGVVLGGAFSTIISSLVKDIITPLLSIILGRINIANLKFTIPGFLGSSPIVLSYGSFLQAILNFLVIAFALFLCVKAINRAKDKFSRKEEAEAAAAEEETTKSEVLLTEIRDLLKEQHTEQ